MMPLMVGTAKRKVGTRPSLRGIATTKYGGSVGTGTTVTMSSSAVAGDLAIFFVSIRGTKTCIPPSGLVKLYDTRDWPKSTNASGNSTTEGLSIYYRWVQSGDASSTWKFKPSGTGSEAIIASCAVYAGVARISTNPKSWTHYGGSWQSSTPILQTASVGTNSLVVGAIASRANANLNVNAPKLTSIDSDYTVRAAESVQVSVLTEAIGLGVVDSTPHGWLEETTIGFGTSSVTSWTHVAFELSGPLEAGWHERDRCPASLAGKPVYIYGTSNTNMIPRMNIDGAGGTWPGTYNEPKWTTQNSWPAQLIEVIDPAHLGNHMGVGGTHAADNVSFAFGTHVNPTQAVTQDLLTTDISQIDQAGTWKAQTNRDLGGIVFLDIIGNDLLYEATPTSQVRDGVEVSVESMVRLLRSKYVRGYVYSGTSYTGSWQNQTSDGADSNTYARTLATGAYVEITLSEPNPELILMARDSDNSLQNGATFDVHVDGVLVTSGTTHNRLRLGASSPTPTYNYVQMAVPLQLDGNSHVVRITHTGASNTTLGYGGYLVPKTNDSEIPWIVLMGMQKMAPVVFTNGQTQARLDAYLQILRNVAAKFPSKVLVYDPMENGQWSYQGWDTAYGPAGAAAKALTLDGIHMNSVGHSFFTMDLLRFLNERIA